MMTLIFLGILAVCLSAFGVFFLLDQKQRWKNEIHSSISGVQQWRQRLNGVTDAFVALGTDPMMEKAASNTEDPLLLKFRGSTLARYRELKSSYVGLSYAYNGVVRGVKQAEAAVEIGGMARLVNIWRDRDLLDTSVVIKEVNPKLFGISLPRSAPKPPAFLTGYLFDVCERLSATLRDGISKIKSQPAQVSARLQKAQEALAACTEQNATLTKQGIAFGPYSTWMTSIELVRAAIHADLEPDPLGALARCDELDQHIKSLKQALTQAGQLLKRLDDKSQELAAQRERVAKVRATTVTCPWSEASSTREQQTWLLSTPDSNPDRHLTDCETLLAQARVSLAAGSVQAASNECAQADDARKQAASMVDRLFQTKNTIDEQLPRARAELSSLRSEATATKGVPGHSEMTELVRRACQAVEDRLGQVRELYQQQKFNEALTLLTTNEGDEHGMPISKLLAQAKELCRLLKQAAEVAGSVQAELTR